MGERMSKLCRLLFALCSVYAVGLTPAKAGFVTGNELLRKCLDKSTTYKGVCASYIEGVVDNFNNMLEAAKMPQCIRPTTEAGQIRDATMKYLHNHPSLRDLNAALLVVGAMRKEWHCK